MKRILIRKCLILFLLTAPSFSIAENYIVKQDINVRSGKGVGYAKLGLIHKGDEVDVLDTSENWGKIKFEGKDGYVSVKFLRRAAEGTVPNNGKNSDGFSNIFLWITIGIIVILLIALRNTLIIRGLFNLIGLLFRLGKNDATIDSVFNRGGQSSQNQKVYCTKCGKIKKPGDISSGSSYVGSGCPNGGNHHWEVA